MTTVMAACMATLAVAHVEEPAATRKRRRDDDEDDVPASEPKRPSDLAWVASDYELRPRTGERIFDDDEEGEVWREVP